MLETQTKNKIKICLIAISYGKGGLERVTALLSKMLVEQGFQVTNVILTDEIDYDFSGEMFNLGKLKKSPDLLISRLIRFRKLKKFLQQENFDFIIDHRSRNNWIKEYFYLKYIYKNQDLVYVIHNFMTWNYLTNKKWMAKKMMQQTKGMIAVSQAITDKLKAEYENINLQTIYNPVEKLSTEKPSDFYLKEKEYILFLGRLDSDVKNIPLLLKAYKKSILPQKDITLALMGSGEITEIQQEIKKLRLTDFVEVLPYNPEVGYYLQQAKFLGLSSKFEGFPMVVVESLSVGTPVVSVDCDSGPREVIQHEKNGLLVENYNPNALAKAMSRMIEEEDLYDECKKNAKKSIEHLQISKISEIWKKYLENLNNKI